MCTANLGKTDVMSPQEQLAYKQATESPSLSIPAPPTLVRRDDSYQIPTGATIKMADGKMITKDSQLKLQQKLKNR